VLAPVRMLPAWKTPTAYACIIRSSEDHIPVVDGLGDVQFFTWLLFCPVCGILDNSRLPASFVDL